jgi:glycosyltransferase involved in cell wall biosynthesis
MIENAPLSEKRILILAHADARVARGGAELSAYHLYRSLNKIVGVQASLLAASAGQFPLDAENSLTQPFGINEYIYSGSRYDSFNHSNADPELHRSLSRVISEARPDVIHLHHYGHFGVESLDVLARISPTSPIVLTLHEYLAICHNHGQMVKRPTLNLCEKSSPFDCAACFPEKSEQDFFLRGAFIKRFLKSAHHFIAPSHFLASRYIAWGIEPTRISVIENCIESTSGGTAPPSGEELVVGFFGQISRLKGINIVFDAARILEKAGLKNVRFEVHGHDTSQPASFRRDFQESLARAPHNVRYFGPYGSENVQDLMSRVHAVVVPSIWWENSPLVIQEARLSRRPVLCSNIGGMAEKVRDGVDGFHFQAGSAQSLANLLKRLARDRTELTRIQERLEPLPSSEAVAQQHLALYRKLLSSNPVGGRP